MLELEGGRPSVLELDGGRPAARTDACVRAEVKGGARECGRRCSTEIRRSEEKGRRRPEEKGRRRPEYKGRRRLGEGRDLQMVRLDRGWAKSLGTGAEERIETNRFFFLT